MAVIIGNSAGVSDTLRGTSGDDRIKGESGDDVIIAGRGDDVIIGGSGADVMSGGLGADEFAFSAGHISDGIVDFIKDFSINAGDTLNFSDSDSADFEVLSVTTGRRDETEANGVNLKNGGATDITFEVYNATTGHTQEIVLLDAWSGSKNDAWEALLADMGLVFGDNTEAPTDLVEVLPVDENDETFTVMLTGDESIVL